MATRLTWQEEVPRRALGVDPRARPVLGPEHVSVVTMTAAAAAAAGGHRTHDTGNKSHDIGHRT